MNNQQELSIPFPLTPTQSYELRAPGDFVTKIRHNSDTHLSFFVHEHNHVDIARDLNLTSATSIHFQSNIYDVLGIGRALLVSNNRMPLGQQQVRVYQIDEANSETSWASICDRKPNSEQFLAPLEFASHNERIVGAGKKFASEYDLSKQTARRIKQADKKYISSVELLDSNVLVTGQFTGDLQLLDLRSYEVTSSTKPHVDLITQIVSRPLSQNHFATSARKDNYSYLWDLRNLDRFVCYFEHQRHGNQRTGLAISEDGRFVYLGGENGELYTHDLSTQEEQSYTVAQQCLNSICCLGQNELVCSFGQRSFPMEGQAESKGLLFQFRHSQS